MEDDKIFDESLGFILCELFELNFKFPEHEWEDCPIRGGRCPHGGNANVCREMDDKRRG